MSENLELHLRKAVTKLQESRLELKALQEKNKMPIAIVGMSCRMPGSANSPALFWDKLLEGNSLISEIPEDRWKKEDYYSANRNSPGKMYTTRAGFIDNIYDFDATFFNLSRREVVMMDPQQRLLLEETWRALEDGGMPITYLRGSQTGVYFGCGSHDYANHLGSSISKDDISAYYGTGNSSSLMAGRVAYFFDFRGPALTIDTSCSSSLVAVNLACSALRNGNISLAIAGGVNAILTPDVMINFCKANMLSEEGLCKTFDNDANGYVRGEGVGVVILKRLEDAIRDNDNILACIIADGVNHDGTSSSLTSPNGDAQVKLFRDTFSEFNISPPTIDYVEAHGTGTPLGDPIEINSLNQIFANSHTNDSPLYVGSVKTNIGHLEAGAGISGMIKTILAMINQKIPSHLHLQKVNSLIDQQKIPFVIPKKAMAWKSNRRHATVSSYGFSGTNALVVLEEYVKPQHNTISKERDWHPFIISAKSKLALQNYVSTIKNLLNNKDYSITDISHTFMVGRAQFAHAMMFSFPNKEEFLKNIDNQKYYCQLPKEREALLLMQIGEIKNPIVILQKLLGTNSSIQNTVDEIQRKLKENSFIDDHSDESHKKYKFILIYALFDLFHSWNIVPDYIIDDRFVRIVYLAYSGAIEMHDAWQLILNENLAIKANVGEMSFINDSNIQAIQDNLVKVNIFDNNGLSQNPQHIIAEVNMINCEMNLWKDIIDGLLCIYQYCGLVNWERFDSPYQRQRLSLPTYPFERQKYFHESHKDNMNVPIALSSSYLLRQISSPFVEHQFIATINVEKHLYLKDHKIYQQLIIPAATFIELMHCCLHECKQLTKYALQEFQIYEALIVKIPTLTLSVSIDKDKIEIFHQDDNDKLQWRKIAAAKWSLANLDNKLNDSSTHQDMINVEPPYQLLQEYQIEYGPHFQSVTSLCIADKICVAKIQVKLDKEHALLSFLDGAFQSVFAFVKDDTHTFQHSIYLPHSFGSMQIYSRDADNIIAILYLKEKNDFSCVVDINIFDEKTNQLLASINDYRVQRVSRKIIHPMKTNLLENYLYQWKWNELENVTESETKLDLYTIDLTSFTEEQLLTSAFKYFELIRTELSNVSNNVDIVFIFNNAWSITNTQTSASQMYMVGLVKSIRQEMRDREIFIVDFDDMAVVHDKRNLNQILQQMKMQGLNDIVVRNKIHYQCQLIQYKIPSSNREMNDAKLYLILGGTSPIMLEFISEMIKINNNANFIVVSRNSRNDSPPFKKVSHMANVQFTYGDLTNQSFVKNLILNISSQFQQISIIHAAGMIEDESFYLMKESQVNDLINIKIKPVLDIYQHCLSLKLRIEKLVCISSVAAAFGSHGQTNYSAANAFLDGFMRHLHINGIKAHSISLPPVHGTPMAEKSILLKHHTSIGITIEEAALAIYLALCNDMPDNFLVLNQSFIEKLYSHKHFKSIFVNNVTKIMSDRETDFSKLVEHLKEKSHSERVHSMKQFLMTELGRVLQLQKHEYNESSGFFELGMDSIMAIELFDSIQQSLGNTIKLNYSILFDLPNIKQLTDYLIQLLFPHQQLPKNNVELENIHRFDQMSDHELLLEIENRINVGDK